MAPLVIAHRTCPRDAPENSLAGIAAAIASGADVVEIDVRRSSDGQPMLLHDRWLWRTARRPVRLEWVTAHRARRMELRGGGTVPMLAEGLAALGPTMRAAIDVKDRGAAAAVLSEVRNQHLEGRVLFWSQHEPAVRTAVAEAPELETSLLRDTDTPAELERFLADAGRLGVGGISAHWSQLGPELAQRCHDADLRLYAWCKTEAVEPEKLALLDGLVTDWPATVRSQIGPSGA
ncbi:MAG: glycerophosphodiester phosphodiesterase [Acidimicrobiia bacterium]|nr:glycerophosphodiester phosphodiesterase [Acidimicrobiia bacterium]